MTLFDLLFIVLFLAGVVSLLVAAWFTVRGQFRRARRIVFRLSTAAAVYMAIVIAVSTILPRRVLQAGDPECFDDVCVALSGFHRIPQGAGAGYVVDWRLFSRARRAAQRENDLAVYLTDNAGRRYNPVASGHDAPFNVLLQPGEAVIVSRSFSLPAEAADVGAVLTHEGGFPIGWLIVGYDTWFRKPPIVKLQ
jgi:hypothetical protein